MSTHQSLTAAYLEAYDEAGPRASDIASAVQDSVKATSYGTRALSRPVFLGHAEHRRLTEDLCTIHDAVAALPHRLFEGDLEKFARAVGMPDRQISAVLRSHRATPPRLSRADLCMSESGFKLMELNMGSTIAGFDNGFLNEGMLGDPLVSQFVTEHSLGYIDSVAELAHTIRSECKVADGTRPMMAIVDWPDSFRTLEPQLRKSSELLARYDLDPHPCHIGQLRIADGAVWLGERRIDIIYRLFTMTDWLTDGGPALIEPVLDAVARGEVEIFTPMEVYVYGSKGVLAMLSDDANRHLFTDGELRSIDQMLPWTRMLRPGQVSVAGRQVDLESHVLAHQDELILKPTLLYAGKGIVPGWLSSPEDWREQIAAAMGGPFLVQQRIHPVVEWFPGDDGLTPWTLVWAAFTMTRGAGGMYIRGGRGTTAGVVNIAMGATGTCCFVEDEPRNAVPRDASVTGAVASTS
jgi:glutathionylspermidine synthase